MGRKRENNGVKCIGSVEPQFPELMALAKAASTLPSWRPFRRSRKPGRFISTLKGKGMEYDESRLYQAGDDIRHIDWRVTARTGNTHTKLFREERDHPVYIAFDINPRMFFATRGVFKVVQAARIAALIAWRAQQGGDRVSCQVFTNAKYLESPLGGGPSSVAKCLKLISDASREARKVRETRTKRSFAENMERLRNLIRPGGCIFLISDFHELEEQSQKVLAQIAARCDTTIIKISDPFEEKLPNLKFAGKVTDSAGSQVTLESLSPLAQSRYEKHFTSLENRIIKFSAANRLRWLAVKTTDNAVTSTRELFSYRI